MKSAAWLIPGASSTVPRMGSCLAIASNEGKSERSGMKRLMAPNPFGAFGAFGAFGFRESGFDVHVLVGAGRTDGGWM
jgi:hypothetical protein